jgi:hypothetical protein
VAFPNEAVAYFKQQGIAVRVVNRSREVISFSACDSFLNMRQEALDSDGNWRALESLPDSNCGNSSHRVFLKPGQYWEFPARRYDGPMKTKLRFCLNGVDGRGPVYSNEFDGAVSAEQFKPPAPPK